MRIYYIVLSLIIYMQDGEEAVTNKLSEMEAAGSQLKAEFVSLTKYVYYIIISYVYIPVQKVSIIIMYILIQAKTCIRMLLN